MAKKVLVLMGGFSAEREVSLTTGKCVCAALKRADYEVVPHDLQNGFELVETLKKEKPDVVFKDAVCDKAGQRRFVGGRIYYPQKRRSGSGSL